MTNAAASPAATGPGGAHFEAKVGAFYLLAMLLDTEPRGLPGARVEKIQFQGAGDGFPLDDVIVHARSFDGDAAVLEVQAKHRITFSPGDAVFEKVAGQITEALKAGKLDSSDFYQLGIATAQSSRKIDGAYQEVLSWARHSETPEAFFRKLARHGVSNADMRTFVDTLKAHVAAFGGDATDERIWTILRRLQILVFDFSAEYGQSEALAREQCKQALDPSERNRAGSLWSALCDLAQKVADSGGEIAAETLRTDLVVKHGFRLEGLRQHRAALTALSEASTHALQDVNIRVGPATLSRREWMEKVNAALDEGRYVEIRGAPGVGKSGILRALAEQEAARSKIIFLSPQRTTPRGWSAMRHQIGFEGTARDLFIELTASGSSTLFIDSIDFFEEPERLTVRDLVSEVADIPGLSVVVTARESFGIDEPNWLPTEAIKKLRRTPVTIDELTELEIKELREAAPALAPLLAENHPARDVVRNLFRLDRVARQQSGDPAPHTEAEMAKQWWQTGDGKKDDQASERTRILRALAQRSISGDAGPLDTSGFPSIPLNQIVSSGTLRELGGERVIFRHDVFRDWAVANLLHEDPAKVAALPLTHPAPASLARGVELAARLAIEEGTDGNAWKRLFDGLGGAGVHGSWPRAALMALVRSELGATTLSRASQRLLADSGRLLKDVIRIVMALEVVPASRIMAGTGIVLPEGASELTIPTGPTWRRLAVWLLAAKDLLPGNLIPAVVELFTTYASASQLFDPLAKLLVAQLQAWLMEMERDRADRGPGRASPFAAALNYNERASLHEYLRSAFAALSPLKPDLAKEYLLFLLENRQTTDHSAQAIIKSPGDLARASPKELAQLTAAVLINKPKKNQRGFGYERDEPFTYVDHEFIPPSPAQGPFLDLLVHSPQDGLAVIRQLVLHACTFGGKPLEDADAVVVELETGPRRFPYTGSYYWSRNAQGAYCVTSALMALEAWGHRRIDSGDEVDAVVADILRDEVLPAAYLLVVVDLVLSHWPMSRKTAVPFLACPELVSWDRTRPVHEAIAFNFESFGRSEPRGLASRDSLKNRASRKFSLEQLVPLYAFADEQKDADALRVRLRSAVQRLGAYDADSDFSDPRLMATCILNKLDRANYREQQIQNENGNAQAAVVYVSPQVEAQHIASLQAQVTERMTGTNLMAQSVRVLDEPDKSSPELISHIIAAARKIDATAEVQADYDNSVLTAAALVMRDGDVTEREEHGAWAAEKFRAAITRSEDPVHRHRGGLQFNPIGIATVGMTAAVRHGGGLADARPLLELAAQGDPAAAHGFGAAMDVLLAIDPRLPKALLRCAFIGNIRPRLLRYGDKNGEDAARLREAEAVRERAVEAEWAWLEGEGDEPEWPKFPPARIGTRQRPFIGEAPPSALTKPEPQANIYFDAQAAAVWLTKFVGRDLIAPDWLRPIAIQYRDWTSALNGAGLDPSDELSDRAAEWNSAYFGLVARSLSGLSADEIDALCLDPILRLPDQAFLDVMAEMLLSLDAVYFEDKGLGAADAVRLRTALADRMEKTSSWLSYKRRPGYGVELHLGGALGTVFMTYAGFRQPPRCYVAPGDIPRAIPFMPLLGDLAGKAPSLSIAIMVLAIASVSTDAPFVRFVAGALHACLRRFPDDTKLWIDYSVGKDFCKWLESVVSAKGVEVLDALAIRASIEEILSNLIRLGLPEAATLETALSKG